MAVSTDLKSISHFIHYPTIVINEAVKSLICNVYNKIVNLERDEGKVIWKLISLFEHIISLYIHIYINNWQPFKGQGHIFWQCIQLLNMVFS